MCSRGLPDDDDSMTASCEGTHRLTHPGRKDASLHTRSLSVATRKFLSLGAPRPVDGRPRQAGFLACGLKSLHHLPGLESSGFRCQAHRLQLRGQPGLIHPSSLKSSYRGTCRVCVRCRKTLRGSTDAIAVIGNAGRLLLFNETGAASVPVVPT